jgi:hypothetical protein
MIQARTKGNQAQSDRADARAASLVPILTKLRAGGVTSSGALAAALTARNIPTLSGRGSWSADLRYHEIPKFADEMHALMHKRHGFTAERELRLS